MKKQGKKQVRKHQRKHEPYSHVSRLIVRYLTGDLNATEAKKLETWINASDDHLHMMAEFSSICWHARQARSFEEPDKRNSWNLIREKVARLPDTPPLPDLRETEWTVTRRAPLLKWLKTLFFPSRSG